VDVGVLGEVDDELAVALTPFGRDELVVVHGASHPLAGLARLDGEALAAHPLIVREPASSTRQTLERALRGAGLRLRVQFELPATDAILSAVAAGLGASVVSSLVVAEPVRGLRFRVRRVAGLDLSRHLAIATHPDVGLGPAAREFVAVLERGGLPPAPSAA
jgi:DNA-binding transcriptional LysR family regulator